ncbi:proteoglycan 4-like isoform X1 [Nematostella vectensis]|uniref:proteoglycan 4-like isoform X1 n=1 Tax=Nematostella vectensis TaxID=45351 RepID=UPI0020772170|nr:proteoglycan 4-like isoform X1 [Nematostella vectensis]
MRTKYKPQTPNKKIVPRLKACPECGTNCPTACRSCKNENCSYIFAKKVKSNHDAIEKKGTTNPTNQKDMMYYRADVLHQKHQNDIVILTFKKHGLGTTVECYGTEGAGAAFVGHEGEKPAHELGKMVKKMFETFMEEYRKKNRVPDPEPPQPFSFQDGATGGPMLAAPSTAMPHAAAATPSSTTQVPPAPTTSGQQPPAPTTATPQPTAPTTATPQPTAPTTATPQPTAPTTATPQPTAPTTATPQPPAPTTATPQPTAPTTATPQPTAPTTATPQPPAPTKAGQQPTAPTTATPQPPAPTTATPQPPAPTTAVPQATATLCSTTKSTLSASASPPPFTVTSKTDTVMYKKDDIWLAAGILMPHLTTLHGHEIPPNHVCVQLTSVKDNVEAPLVLGNSVENRYLQKGMFFALPKDSLCKAVMVGLNRLALQKLC